MGEHESLELDPDVRRQVDGFASDLMTLWSKVLEQGVSFTVTIRPLKGGRAVAFVHPTDELGVPLTVQGSEVFRVLVRYEMRSTPGSKILAVEKSSFKVHVTGSNRPLFTLDYVHEIQGGLPAAHYNMHAEREDMVKALSSAGRRHRGKLRRREIERGRTPTYSDLHFPLGGHRFRPCLEDVIEMLILEFGIDCLSGARASLRASRRAWRKRQLAAAIGDDPETAANELKRLGYEFSTTGASDERLDRTTAL